MKPIQWIMSEAGLQSLISAGISTVWIKAWLHSAGATEVSLHFLASTSWQQTGKGWHIFFATPNELDNINKQSNVQTLLLPVGDIVHQRHHWLALLNDAQPLMPLYVRADESLNFELEPGLSASLRKPSDDQYLNAQGLLIEEQVIECLKHHKLSLRTVESCTAGAIAARLSRVPGASDVLDRAWVTYSNAAKQEEVGVVIEKLNQFGAVSQEVVVAMAEGGANASSVCIAVSGIAGPSGGSKEKPVGTVWFAVALKGINTRSQCLHLTGARHEIQTRAVIAALYLLLDTVGLQGNPG